MGAEVVVVVVMEPLDGRLPGRAVHPLDLAIPPRVRHLGQSMFDLMLPADAVKRQTRSNMCSKAFISRLRFANCTPLSISTVCRRQGTAAIRSRKNWAAAIFPAFLTGWVKANVLARSMPTNRSSFPSAVRTSAMSI